MNDLNKPVVERHSPEKVAANATLLSNIRILVAIFAGCASGILGYSNIVGLVFFLASQTALSFLLFIVLGAKKTATHTFFASPSSVWVDGISGAIMTYVLFWTMLYNIVHVY